MQSIRLLGTGCVNLTRLRKIRKFLTFCKKRIGVKGAKKPEIKWHQKSMVPEASGYSGKLKLQGDLGRGGGGFITVSTFPFLRDEDGTSVHIYATLPDERIPLSLEVFTAGIREFFKATKVEEL